MANSLDMDLTYKVVVLSSSYYKGSEAERTVLVLGGFGSVGFTSGSALSVRRLSTRDSFRASGYQVEKLAEIQLTPEELELIKNPPTKKEPGIGKRKVKHS